MCVYFFAFNRHCYSQNIPEYIARMYGLRDSNPDIWKEFESGSFVVNTNPIPFTSVGPD